LDEGVQLVGVLEVTVEMVVQQLQRDRLAQVLEVEELLGEACLLLDGFYKPEMVEEVVLEF
jgi:hypothetical protein